MTAQEANQQEKAELIGQRKELWAEYRKTHEVDYILENENWQEARAKIKTEIEAITEEIKQLPAIPMVVFLAAKATA